MPYPIPQPGRQGPPAWLSIEEFASVLVGRGKHKAVAVFGYFDESGTSRADPVAMYGGMVAKAAEWASIEGEWRSKLAEYGLREYHAVECENRLGDYAPYERPIRDSLTNYFSALIARLRGQAFGSAINYGSWERLVPQGIKDNYGGDPLYFSAALAFQQVSTWAVEHNDGEPVALIFATHEKHNGPVAQLFADFKASGQWPMLGSITFADPQYKFPVQAADLLCYEMKRLLTHPHERRQARENFKEGGKMGMDFRGFNDENLPALVAKWERLYPSLVAS